MENNTKRYTVTAALPYANGPLHIGHIAGAYLPADIYVRYLKANDKDVAFICGSDEHGAAITLRAKKEGISPQAIIDKYHKVIGDSFIDLGINFDIFHRTSSKLHHKTAQEFFLNLDKKGVFTQKTSEQFYDEEHKQFLADRYIVGTCPNCGFEGAYGDQCEKCGSSLSPTDLINPKSTLSGKTPILKETSLWYLPMGDHEKWLKEWINDGTIDGKKLHVPKEWKNQVLGQCNSWIDGGLHDRAMTRDLDWGVKVPYETAEGKVLYVWLDAPIGYISATKQWADNNGKNWEDYWKNEDTELVHFIGKDNIVFHAIIFPIILKAHGDYILPKNVPANEFLNLEGDKISTSRNWAVWVHEYVKDLPNKEDVLRYVLGTILPENKDAEFTWKDFQDRNNNELVANLGNFVNRAIVLTNKYFDGVVPTQGELSEEDSFILDELKTFPNKISHDIEHYKFKDALQQVMNISRLGNKYFADTEPWKLIKTDEERVKTILNIGLQICANIQILIEPFLPFTAKKLQEFLNTPNLHWNQAGSINLIHYNHQISKGGLLFEKISDEFVTEQIQRLEDAKKAKLASNIEPQKEKTTFDDFQKMDIRVGEIIEAEKIKKAKKLLKLTVDTGIDKRIVVSGIAEHYSPEEIIGKKVSILVNLASRKIRGVESQGMILMAENGAGDLSFISPEKEMNNGGLIS